MRDFRRASLALSIATMVMAATTTAIASSASILDQRPTLRLLRLAGTPIGTVQRARAWQASLPLVAATMGSLATGAAAAMLLLAAAGNAPDGLGAGDMATMLGLLGVGLALTTASAIVTRPSRRRSLIPARSAGWCALARWPGGASHRGDRVGAAGRAVGDRRGRLRGR